MRFVEAFNRFFEQWGWVLWLLILAGNLWPPASRPAFVALAGFMLGIHLHRRFGTTLVDGKKTRIKWERWS